MFVQLILILSVCMTYIHAEICVAVYDQNKVHALTDADKDVFCKDQEGIFKILTTYRWPTSLLYALPSEREKLFENKPLAEIDFINQYFKQKLKTDRYQAFFVPDVVYQLAAIVYCLEDFKQAESLAGKCALQIGDFLGNFLVQEKEGYSFEYIALPGTYASFLSACHFDMSLLGLLDFSIQQKIGNDLAALGVQSLYGISADICKKLAYEYCSKIYALRKNIEVMPQIPNISSVFNAFDFGNMIFELYNVQLKEKGIVSNLIDFEMAAHVHNQATLYNASGSFKQLFGSTTVELLTSPLKINNDGSYQQHIISYGLYPFAGAFYCKDDMPYYYALEQNNYFFALTVNKSEYLKNRCNNLFLIPPFSPLAQLFGLDTLYHPLSTAAFAHAPDPLDILKVDGFEDPFPLQDPGHIEVITMDPYKHAALLSKYSQDNAHLLKVPENVTWEKGVELLHNFEQASLCYADLELLALYASFSKELAVLVV